VHNSRFLHRKSRQWNPWITPAHKSGAQPPAFPLAGAA
jgi:hypothetical protein